MTEQDDGVLIAGTAPLFPVMAILYGGIKMIFLAYEEYRKRRDARIREREAQFEKAMDEARKQGRTEARAEIYAKELIRLRPILREHNVSLTPGIERLLSDDGDGLS